MGSLEWQQDVLRDHSLMTSRSQRGKGVPTFCDTMNESVLLLEWQKGEGVRKYPKLRGVIYGW